MALAQYLLLLLGAVGQLGADVKHDLTRQQHAEVSVGSRLVRCTGTIISIQKVTTAVGNILLVSSPPEKLGKSFKAMRDAMASKKRMKAADPCSVLRNSCAIVRR
jgi:hypothetical protein